MTKTDSIIISSRFCGPPSSGNGGYSVGLLAREFNYRAEVTLRLPPPLDTPLFIERDGDTVRLLDGEKLVAEAVRWQGELSPPAMISGEDAEHAAEGYVGFHHHHFPGCFVCGPDRGKDDGLRIFPGHASPNMAEGRDVFAAPWTPSENLADEDGNIDPLFIAAALDCPGYFSLAMRDKALLGRMSLNISGGLKLGDTATVVSRKDGEEGRKRFASTAIYGPDGSLVAASRQVWIVLK